MSRIVLDAGALVAYDRGERRMRTILTGGRRIGLDLATTAPVIAQVWRDGRKQALLAKLLPAIEIAAPDEAAGRRAGELLARTKTSDVVDALVVGVVREGDLIATSDPDDIERLLDAAGVRATIIDI